MTMTAASDSEATTPLFTMERRIEEYLAVVARKRAYSTVIFVPLAAIAVSLLLTGNYHILLDYMLLPSITLLLRILGTALGIGLGLGLATHVHDILETWHSNEHEHGNVRASSLRTTTTTTSSMLLRTSSMVHHHDDETSYAALMTSAGYNVSDGLSRGQITKQSPLETNYPYTSVPENDQVGVSIMKQQWPHLPLPITHALGCWIEYIIRDYVAIWYCRMDSACPYQDEQETRKQQQELLEQEENKKESSHGNANGENPQQQQEQQKSRRMIFTLAPHRPLPLMTAMYHSLATLLGNLTTRVEHVNVYSLVLLKFTKVLAMKLKTYRELRIMALEKSGSSSGSIGMMDTTTTLEDSSQHATNGGNDAPPPNASSLYRKQQQRRRRPVSEMCMTKEFLLAGKLHRAVTFGMDVPSLLFADASGKECSTMDSTTTTTVTTQDENYDYLSTEEQVLERRLFASNMILECEMDYNRVLGHRLCRALLPRNEFSSPIVRTIMTELLSGCILSPIMGCFSPDYVNSWISTGLESTSMLVSSVKKSNGSSTERQERQWDFDESGEGVQVGATQVELEATYEEVADFDDEGEEAIEVIRNPTDDASEDGSEDLGQDNHVLVGEDDDETRHDSETVSGDYILPLLTMAIIDLQRFVDFASLDAEESGTDWDDSACQDAVRQVVLVIEAALIHGRRRQRLTKRKRSMTGDDAKKMDHEGDTLLPFFSSNLSQVLMELTSDIDAFGARIAMEETRLKSDENAEKVSDSPSMSCKPSMSEVSTLRTLIAAWLHTGQVYKMLSILIQARQSILIPYFHEDAFLRSSENAAGFVSQVRALDGFEIMVDTTSILASSTLDNIGKSTAPGRASSQKRAITIQATLPSGSNSVAQPSPRAMASSLSQSVARGGERLQRFMSGGGTEETSEYAAAANLKTSPSASSASIASLSNDGPTPRYLDFHRNKNFALSLRTERERRKESWQHVSASLTDQGLKIVHRAKGTTEEDMEDHRDLHRLSRTFYSGTNTIGLKDGSRRTQSDAGDTPSKEADTDGHDNESQVVRVSLLTVEMVGTKRRIEIPDDDSSFLIRAQPRPLKAVGMHIDQRNHGQTYRTFAATYEEAAVPSGSFCYSGGRYIRKCALKYFPNDRTATIELPPSDSTRTLDCRKVSFGPPTSISIGPPKAQPLSGDFLRKHHLCLKWVPRGAAPRSGSSILASPTMEPTDFHSVPRAGKSIDFVYRMSLFECPMVELSGKKFTVHDSSVMGSHRADASSMELSDTSLSVALLTAGQDWEHQLSERSEEEDDDEAPSEDRVPGVEMGPDGYPIVWIKLHKKQGENVTTEIKPYRASYMRAALLLASTRQEAQRQCLVMCVRAGSARNATRARVDSLLKPAQRLLEFATSQSRDKQSILMRDLKLGINHVDREQLRRNKLLYPRYPTNIHSLTAVVEGCMPAKDTGVTFAGSSSTTTVYKIRCVAIVELVDTNDEEEDWAEYDSPDGTRATLFREEWVVYRQFRDFNALHKHLKSQVSITETSGTASSRLVGAATAAFTVGAAPSGVDRRRKALIPSLGQASKAGALGLTQKAIEKRRAILHTYLQHFLAPNHPLRQCSEVLTFLGAFHPFPADIRIGDAPSTVPDGLGRVGLVRAVYGESPTTSAATDASRHSERNSASTPQKPAGTKPLSFSASDSMTSPGDDLGSARSKSTRIKEDDMTPAFKAKIDKVPLGKVRNAMFELIRSQFDFENASFFRNRLLTALKTMSFAVASNGEFRKTMYEVHKTYLNPDAIGDLIKMGLEMLWPDGVFYESSPALTPEQSKELAEKMKMLLVNAFPDQVRSILGAEITEDGLEMLHEMLQNRVVLKSLFYMFVDLLLLEVFPEFQDFLTGGAALESD